MNKLLWEQRFQGGHSDLSAWNIRLGNDLLDDEGKAICPGWGNGEEQYYTGNSQNVYMDEQGLQLCARLETVEQNGRTFRYTSARLDTRDRFSFCYGKLVVRARLPIGNGLWPAVWMMPQHQTYGPWPASGEIDILEAKGRLPGQIFGTLHYGEDFERKKIKEFSHRFEEGTIAEFHDYALEWSADSIRWLIDGHCYAEQALQQEKMPFDQPFYLVMNLAVGGWFDKTQVDEAALPGVMTIAGIWLYQ